MQPERHRYQSSAKNNPVIDKQNSDFNDSKQQRKTNEYNKQKLDITQKPSIQVVVIQK